MEEEIDLGAIIIKAIEIIKRKVILIFLIFSFSFLIGYFLYNSKKTECEFQTIVYFDTKFSSSTVQILSRLNYLFQNEDLESLSKDMEIPKEEVMKIIEISSETEDSKNFFTLKLHTKSRDIDREKIELGILNFLKKNTIQKKISSLEIDRYKHTIEFINLEKIKIDSILVNYKGNNLIENLGNLEESLLMLQDMRDEYQYNLDLIEASYSLFQPLSYVDTLAKFKVYMLMSLLIAIVLTAILIFIHLILDSSKENKVLTDLSKPNKVVVQ